MSGFQSDESKTDIYGDQKKSASFPLLKVAMFGCYILSVVFLIFGIFSQLQTGLIFAGLAFTSIIYAEIIRILLAIFNNSEKKK